MSKANFTEDFKRDAVVQIIERGYPVAEVAARLGISKYSLYERRKRYGKPAAAARDDDQAAEVRRLKRELQRVTEERDIPKEAAAYFANDAKRSTRSSPSIAARAAKSMAIHWPTGDCLPSPQGASFTTIWRTWARAAVPTGLRG
ncbi:transposase-like protein [Kaistia dalseonensis]|uniref:Transposase-like protein n=1 Tax=Kaistia dalseonensis TaxID=410840 RepID=A0ABU0H916_9HYPH|nr:transposase-like protein [Kaistia dalseonensis]